MFRKYIHAFIFFGILFSCFQLSSQNYVLESSGFTLIDDATNISSILTRTDNSFIWVQKYEEHSNDIPFTIIDTSGNWNYKTSQGELVHSFYLEGFTANFKLTGDTNGLSAVLTITKNKETPMTYKFDNVTITYL
jgi:hypothetical protein